MSLDFQCRQSTWQILEQHEFLYCSLFANVIGLLNDSNTIPNMEKISLSSVEAVVTVFFVDWSCSTAIPLAGFLTGCYLKLDIKWKCLWVRAMNLITILQKDSWLSNISHIFIGSIWLIGMVTSIMINRIQKFCNMLKRRISNSFWQEAEDIKGLPIKTFHCNYSPALTLSF